MIWPAVGTTAFLTLLVGFGLGLITPISWHLIALTRGYASSGCSSRTGVKLAVYRHLSRSGPRHQQFLRRLQEHLHPGP
jgi:hypothetical protein